MRKILSLLLAIMLLTGPAFAGNKPGYMTPDQKAALDGANSPSASNVLATEADITSADTGVQKVTAGVNLSNSGDDDNPILDLDISEDVDFNDFKGTNLADAVNPTDAVNLQTMLNTYGIVLNYWLMPSNSLGLDLTESVAYDTETVTSTPQTLSNIYFKSIVEDTPTPFVVKNGAIIQVHFEAKVASVTGTKPTTLHAELYYVDSDGTTSPEQIGADGDETATLTETKTVHSTHIHADTDIIVPAGKRLWLKYVATTTGATNNPIVWVYNGSVSGHIDIGVSSTILGRYLLKAGGTMSGDIDMDGSYQIVDLQVPAAAGEAIRQTAKIDESKLESLYDNRITSITAPLDLTTQTLSIPAGTNTQHGYITSTFVAEIEANTLKVTNVSTALSEGTRDDTTYAINSDGSSPDLILPQANTNEAGLLSGTKWNEIVANTSAKHTQGTDTTLGDMTEDINMNTSYQVVNLQAPAAAGEAIRQTTKITEVILEALYDNRATTYTAPLDLTTQTVSMSNVDNSATDGYLTWEQFAILENKYTQDEADALLLLKMDLTDTDIFALVDGTRPFTGEQDFQDGIKADTIVESTAEAGVTIEGTLHKDNNIYTGPIQITENAGAVTLVDMSVTDTPAQGVEQSYALKIDGTTVLKIYAESDGSGGIQNQRIESSITRYLHWSPAYDGYALSADGGSNDGGDSGILVAFAGTLGDTDTTDTAYIEWASTTAGVNDYDVIIRVPIPADYSSIGTMTVEYMSDTVLEDTATVSLYDSNDAADSSVVLSSSTWAIDETMTPSGTYTAGEHMTIKLHLEAAQNQYIRIGEIKIPYVATR